MITDREPVDSTAVLCHWKHLVEVNALCSQAVMLEVVVVVLSCVQQHVLATQSMCTHARLFKHVSVCLFLSHHSLSVQTVLGGGRVCGGGVVWQGTSAATSRPTLQQVLQLSGHAAGESCVDPRVGA